MNAFVPKEKMSKKKKRELNSERRRMWAISPVSRKSKSLKAYDRKRSRKPDDSGIGSVICA